MAEDKKECKIINLQDWAKNKEIKDKEKARQKILRAILERGNPLDKKIE